MRYRILRHLLLAIPLAILLAGCGGSSGDAAWYARNTLYSYSGDEGNLWVPMRKNMRFANYYTYTPRVRQQIKWLQNHQPYLNHAIAESAPYIYYIYQQTQKHHLPAELALIPIIESEYNPYVTSQVGADGLWQMMPKTARGFGLKRDHWYDGSRDLVASTNAALNYFNYLHHFFNNNWLLAIAAYDSGEGTVMAAIHYNRVHHRSIDYWNLPLPYETQVYVPRLLALAAIIKDPAYYHVRLVPINNAPYIEQVNVGKPMTLSKAATLAEVPVTTMKVLNPAVQHDNLDPYGPYVLIVPKDKVDTFRMKLAALTTHEKLVWQKHIVQSKENLAKIAQEYRVTVAALREANGLKSNAVHPDQTLLIPPTNPSDTNLSVLADNHSMDMSKTLADQNAAQGDADNADNTDKTATIPTPLPTEYTVNSNESLHHIATRFHTTTHKIRALNHLASDHIKVGQVLKIPTSAKITTTAVAANDAAPAHIYVVRKGDYIEKIAKRFHTTPERLKQINQLAEDDILQPGQKLKIHADA